jgi:hypothetical protein
VCRVGSLVVVVASGATAFGVLVTPLFALVVTSMFVTGLAANVGDRRCPRCGQHFLGARQVLGAGCAHCGIRIGTPKFAVIGPPPPPPKEGPLYGGD